MANLEDARPPQEESGSAAGTLRALLFKAVASLEIPSWAAAAVISAVKIDGRWDLEVRFSRAPAPKNPQSAERYIPPPTSRTEAPR